MVDWFWPVYWKVKLFREKKKIIRQQVGYYCSHPTNSIQMFDIFKNGSIAWKSLILSTSFAGENPDGHRPF